MISLRMSLTVSLLFLIFISVVAQDWGVNYKLKYICALKGSTVDMSCTYTYPWGWDHSVQKAFWTKFLPTGGNEPPDLSDDPDYKDRVQYLGNTKPNSTFRLRDVTEKDQSKYYFRFITNRDRYQGKDGVYLSVTDLQVKVPERVMEGDKVTLTCKTTCRLTDSPTFTWYKNGQRLSSGTEQLHLQVSSDDTDRYQCGVLNQKLLSPDVTLNVRYPPKNISVFISPSGEIVEDSSVTLTCNSDGNPPVKYNWFKGESSVSERETYTINNIRSVDSGEYKCKSCNEHGVKYSDAVTINVLYPPKNISVSISPSGEIMEDSSVTLTCNSDGNPPVNKYTWFKKMDKDNVEKWTQQTYEILNISPADSGEYQCMATNTKGPQSSEYKSISVLYGPKNVWVSISKVTENNSRTLTCNSDANPPVQNYTWFKEGGSSPVGSGHSYSALQSGSFYCVAINKYGNQTSATVTVNLQELKDVILYAANGVIVGCGCLLVIIAIMVVRRKRKRDSNANDGQDNIYSNVTVGAAANKTTPDPDKSKQDNQDYSNIEPYRVRNCGNAESSAVKTSAIGADEEPQYATVQHRQNKDVEKTQGGDIQYASVAFTRTGATDRSAASTLEDPSVIYSSVK